MNAFFSSFVGYFLDVFSITVSATMVVMSTWKASEISADDWKSLLTDGVRQDKVCDPVIVRFAATAFVVHLVFVCVMVSAVVAGCMRRDFCRLHRIFSEDEVHSKVHGRLTDYDYL